MGTYRMIINTNPSHRKTSVFKTHDGMWTVRIFHSPWAMIPTYLKFSDWDDAMAIATGKLVK